METGSLPIIDRPLRWNPWVFAVVIWVTIFWMEILLTGLDQDRAALTLGGWRAFRWGCGLFVPLWALSAAKLLRLVPTVTRWYHHRWVRALILLGSVLVSVFIWFAGPLTSGRGQALVWMPSKVYFQVVSIPVTYLLTISLAAAGTEVVRQLRSGWMVFPFWAAKWVMVLTVSALGFVLTNALDWEFFILRGLSPHSTILAHLGRMELTPLQNGSLGFLSYPWLWSPLEFALVLWFVIFLVEFLSTWFDQGAGLRLDGWKAFLVGCGICIPVWAYALGKLEPILPASGQWWQHPRSHWYVVLASLLLSVFIWFAGPALGAFQRAGLWALRGRGWDDVDVRPSKVYFQLALMPVAYWLLVPTLAVTTAVWHRVGTEGWSSLSGWSYTPWVIVLTVALLAYLGSNAYDWIFHLGRGNLPKGWLIPWGVVVVSVSAWHFLRLGSPLATWLAALG